MASRTYIGSPDVARSISLRHDDTVSSTSRLLNRKICLTALPTLIPYITVWKGVKFSPAVLMTLPPAGGGAPQIGRSTGRARQRSGELAGSVAAAGLEHAVRRRWSA